MWTCPRCGRAFANRNQRHACGSWTLDDHVRDASRDVAAIVRDFVALVERCGPADMVATKTRIGRTKRADSVPIRPHAVTHAL
jgi:hypothetical protein